MNSKKTIKNEDQESQDISTVLEAREIWRMLTNIASGKEKLIFPPWQGMSGSCPDFHAKDKEAKDKEDE